MASIVFGILIILAVFGGMFLHFCHSVGLVKTVAAFAIAIGIAAGLLAGVFLVVAGVMERK